MARSILLAAITLFGLASVPASAQSPVALAATICPQSIRLEVTGPPGAGFAVLVSACARGGFLHGHRIDVEYLHPLENLLGGGELDGDGRGTVEVSRRHGNLQRVAEAYLQAVAFGIEEPRRVLGVSATLRFRAGPPPLIEPWRRVPGRGWLLALIVLTCALLGVRGRRRGHDLRKRFATAAALLLVVGYLSLRQWPRLVPPAFGRHGMSQARVDARILGDQLAAALVALRDQVPGAGAIRVHLCPGAQLVAPRILQYYLYPRRLLLDAAAAEAARREGGEVLLLAAEPCTPPPAGGYRRLPAFRAPGFRLFRAGERGRP